MLPERGRPEAAAGFPIVSNGGRTYTFPDQEGLPLLERHARDGIELAYAILRTLNPNAVAGRSPSRTSWAPRP